ncbi:MAG: phytanoyl-CoA dioxygenase family protein [Gammaproteobacteria bacterium]|nr:phytanoyl-CoA dioxygenase family protein [Gammaproteobacteria bacterium]
MDTSLATTTGLMPAQREIFARDGYLVLPGFAPAAVLRELQEAARDELAARRSPLEYESQADYPGLPSQVNTDTGDTARRLLQAYDRQPAFAAWATSVALVEVMQSLIGDDILLVRNHHNCLMTKHPQGGSRTGWHRDTRYWHFTRPELVNAWLALDTESPDNGALRVVPGSHRLDLSLERMDDALFLRDDPSNQDLLANAVSLNLSPGDVLLFHSHLLHAAGNNRTGAVKHSLVFTYRAADNPPLPGSRSSRLSDIPLSG